MSSESKIDTEWESVKNVVHNSIGWALNKDKDLLYSCLAQDADFFIYHPDSRSTIVGFDAFKNLTENFFMNDDFKATGFEVKDLRINFSKTGDVAWYSALLDDFGEWQGRPTSWVNARWTGVLEKRDGNWVITQMHFSFASDAVKEEEAVDSEAGEGK